MTAQRPAPDSKQDWKRQVRLGMLAAVGALGFASRWYPIPRWTVLLAAITVPAVWMTLNFESLRPGETETHRRQRMRNIAIGWALFALVALFYLATMARLGTNVLNRPI